MNGWLLCLWLVIAGALLRVGWEVVGLAFEWAADRLSRARRRKPLVERSEDPHNI